MNAYQAAIRSGYTEKTAKAKSSLWLEKVGIQEAIKIRMNNLQKRTEITQEEMLINWLQIVG